MKIALCFSGKISQLNNTKNFWLGLINKYDIDVYGSFWDTSTFVDDNIDNFIKIYSPKQVEVENYEAFKISTHNIAKTYVKTPSHLFKHLYESTKEFNIFSMYYKIWRANLLSKTQGINYDIVVRARTDTFLDEKLEITYNHYLNVPMGITYAESIENSQGINDLFAYGTPEIMDYYAFISFRALEYVSHNHTTFPGEHLLLVHFSKTQSDIRFLPSYITIVRNQIVHEVFNKFVTHINEEHVMSSNNILITPP